MRYWIAGAGDTKFGPYSAKLIHQFLSEGRVNAESRITTQSVDLTAESWSRIADIPEFQQTDEVPVAEKVCNEPGQDVSVPTSAIDSRPPDWISQRERLHWQYMVIVVRGFEQLGPWAQNITRQVMPVLFTAMRAWGRQHPEPRLHPRDCRCTSCHEMKMRGPYMESLKHKRRH